MRRIGATWIALALVACADGQIEGDETVPDPPTLDHQTSSQEEVGAGPSNDENVTALARDVGWRDGLDLQSLDDDDRPIAGLLELAADRESAERIWSENVPENVDARTGEPTEPGVYGHLSDVDFEQAVVGVWSGVSSSTCPNWLASLTYTDDRSLEIRTRDASDRDDECTADDQPYRMIVSIEREHLPPIEELDFGRISPRSSSSEFVHNVDYFVSIYPVNSNPNGRD